MIVPVVAGYQPATSAGKGRRLKGSDVADRGPARACISARGHQWSPNGEFHTLGQLFFGLAGRMRAKGCGRSTDGSGRAAGAPAVCDMSCATEPECLKVTASKQAEGGCYDRSRCSL